MLRKHSDKKLFSNQDLKNFSVNDNTLRKQAEERVDRNIAVAGSSLILTTVEVLTNTPILLPMATPGLIYIEVPVGVDAYRSIFNDRKCGAFGDKYLDVGVLATGASKTITVSLAAGAAREKTLRAFVDSWCETSESNDGNNQFTQCYSVQ
ncbi:hypothetical protein CCP3SC5AM1_610007 [Gammaproteobacteria bacterium]